MAKRIVILTQKEIGDLIVVTPLLRALKKHFPDGEIILASRPVAREIYAGNSAISSFLDVHLSEVKRGAFFRRIRAFFGYARKIRRLGADILLQLEANDIMAIWSFFSGAKIRVSVRNQTFARLFTAINTLSEGRQSALLFYLSFLDPLGIPRAGLATELFAHKKQNRPLGRRNVLIHPGARIPEKLWPAEKWAEFISILRKKYPALKLRIVRSSFDPEITAALARQLPQKIRVEWVAVDNFSDLCTAVAGSDLAIVLDSSPRHVAAAYGIPTIAVLPQWTLLDWGIYDESKHRVVVSETARPRHGLETVEVSAVVKAFAEYWKQLMRTGRKKYEPV